MNKQQFNNLEITEQIQYINKQYRKEITYFKQQRCNKYITETK
ncbi:MULTISPECIES: hypothetical protein [Romboutsia]|nr:MULTISPECIES: hypothetical protein [Romboutsia]